MKQSHLIRLRGGWKLSIGHDTFPWTLPCPAISFASFSGPITLTRRFQHPPVRSTHQVTRLVARSIDGATIATLDGLKVSLDELSAGVILNKDVSTHELTITLFTDSITDPEEWGQFGIMIEDNANESV